MKQLTELVRCMRRFAVPRMTNSVIMLMILLPSLLTAQRGSNKVVTILFSPSGKGDRSYNDMVLRGVDSAKHTLSGFTVREVQPPPGQELRTLTAVARAKPDLIIAVGFTFGAAVRQVAPLSTTTKFLILDDIADVSNVRSATFRSEEGSLLAGVAAAYFTRSNKVGFVVGMDIPIMQRFECGYRHGVLIGANLFRHQAVVVTKVSVSATDGFSRPDLGSEKALDLYRAGNDVVFHAAGGSGLGVIQAAKQEQKIVIGVDYDQREEIGYSGIRTSMLKRLDRVTYLAIEDALKNRYSSGTISYGLARKGEPIDGVGLVKPKDFPSDLSRVVDSVSMEVRAKRLPVCAQ